jgi:starvation-inducible outer membrane lipoprotein
MKVSLILVSLVAFMLTACSTIDTSTVDDGAATPKKIFKRVRHKGDSGYGY